ncbi:cytochrome P450 [Ralstonia solanacearum]|uniref:Rhih cytochrome p450 monooxygenase, rhizoxin biosynthesis n=1 Tax=Ralstonia solanacearum (strain Po82) TaxID=1031711 RepID=F6G366_RALS8|nr:cytochrome P450 [Ralstonia solanacearum]AEG69561.1 rhih cytochrome p450 monooxygenase, rhizoxin biosynthesis [Ralstonia solanacearum Po82]AMP70167.1 cytochrome [Ralstonia solanacearum]AMP75332.1 cytochrome [Ralstonia solanacearum]AYB61053.1 cytochrome P450 [Ralstonia solanacearum]EUJ14410.1 cytochrome P450 [Ralstonia solanacearum P673]
MSEIENMETLNLSSSEIEPHRYRLYEAHRQNAPALWYPAANSWLIFRHGDAASLARSPLVRTDYLVREKISDAMLEADPALREIVATISRWMIYNEAPIHGRLRTFMSRTFDRGYIERVRGRIASILAPRIEALKGRTEFDFVEALAHPVPAEILAAMLGLDEIDIVDFLRWSDAIADFMQDFVISPVPNRQIAQATAEQLLEMKAALREAIAVRRRLPKEDLLTDLACATGDDGSTITEEELMLQLIHLIFGGHKIPQFVLANTLHLLFKNPQYMLHGEEATFDKVSKLVDESMRVESPIQFITRHAVDDFELNGQTIKKGDSIYLMLGSANRDPEVYSDPDTFQPYAPKRKGIHYGTGPHVCIGAALAGVTIAEILCSFLQATRSVEALYDLDHPEWTRNDTFHGVARMPVKAEYR